MFGRKNKYIVFYAEEINGFTKGEILTKIKDSEGNVISYVADVYGKDFVVRLEDAVGPFEFLQAVGVMHALNVKCDEILKLQEEIKNLTAKVDNIALSQATLLAAVKLITENKHGKSKTHNCECSGQCSGNCKQGR